jgi:multidrug efflux pump subunit AcrA (membrane-fusion protein)
MADTDSIDLLTALDLLGKAEAQIEELREDRDKARRVAQVWRRKREAAASERMLVAEALVAELEAELREDRDEARRVAQVWRRKREAASERMLVAEALVAELEAARKAAIMLLDECLNDEEPWDADVLVEHMEATRAALAAVRQEKP